MTKNKKIDSPYTIDCLLVSIIMAQMYWLRLYFGGYKSSSYTWGKSIYTFGESWFIFIIPSTIILLLCGLYIKKRRTVYLPMLSFTFMTIMELTLPKIVT